MTAFAERIREIPEIFDAERGGDVLASVQKALEQDSGCARAVEILRAPKVAAFLTAVFSGSPFLAALCERNPTLLAACLAEDPETSLPEAAARLEAAMAQAASEAEAWRVCARSNSTAHY
ncbi:hypothetical protein AUC68_08390 [Methyloceanibacter methanicus]|uniref:Uncharacterized protein n=1 Tax=Methyloceanibacter methanicus TaxID=1774968 RepID=A0A1E3VY49_9HYPH|nr:hypothetical protein [Methyloceanibacter methanicus]ODR98442.1 hypothetical protein AUC68_08390 [Methyloceanibacter methanicus]